MSYNWRIGHGAGHKKDVAPTTIERIQSADGSRWAYSRNRKRRLSGGCYDVVESWIIRQRVEGKVVTVSTDAFEKEAREFVGATP
jgi:hypothetical protein